MRDRHDSLPFFYHSSVALGTLLVNDEKSSTFARELIRGGFQPPATYWLLVLVLLIMWLDETSPRERRSLIFLVFRDWVPFGEPLTYNVDIVEIMHIRSVIRDKALINKIQYILFHGVTIKSC